jgi:uncharacterized damage-inducible protein DinB
MHHDEYIPVVIREFEGMKRLADKAIAQLSAEKFFAKLTDTDNSVAVLVKHVAGNQRSRWMDFLSSDGEKLDRKRDAEFVILPEDTRDQLLENWEDGWALLLGALKPLQSADLERTVKIRGEPLSVLQAINRQHTHYAYHTGQIVFLAKHWAGAQWKSLSIPVGQSEQFNRAPTSYLERR